MSTDDMQRQIISRLLSQPPQNVAELTLQLWESLAAELVPIVGEDGFAMLYMRSLHLTRITFPWLAIDAQDEHALHKANAQFAWLKISLQNKPAEAVDASRTLLITFTDILAALIGEPLTNGILRAAWGDDASEITSKDFDHE